MKTEWEQNENGEWSWVTYADNNEPIADSADDGYGELDDAVYGFLLSQGNTIEPEAKGIVVKEFVAGLGRTENGGYVYPFAAGVAFEEPLPEPVQPELPLEAAPDEAPTAE